MPCVLEYQLNSTNEGKGKRSTVNDRAKPRDYKKWRKR
jgi:hypothetical protein